MSHVCHTPACDICKKPFTAGQYLHDAKTHGGRWGVFCSDCFRAHCPGLGVGRGQRYVFGVEQKIAG